MKTGHLAQDDGVARLALPACDGIPVHDLAFHRVCRFRHMRRGDRPIVNAYSGEPSFAVVDLEDLDEARRTYSDVRGVRPERSHSDTPAGASTAVICAASTNVSEMIETQNSFVSRIFWFVSACQRLM